MTIRGSYEHPWLNQHKDVFGHLYAQIRAKWKHTVTVVKQLDSIPEAQVAVDLDSETETQEITLKRSVRRRKPRVIDSV